AAHGQVVAVVVETGGAHVGLDQPVVHPSLPGDREHLGGDVDADDVGHAVGLQPGSGAARTAAQVDGPVGRAPGDGVDPVEQGQVHLVLDGGLIGRHPVAVAV